MESSFFPGEPLTFPDAESLPIGGATCQCFKVRLYGKLHFLKQLKPELRSDPRYVAALQKEFQTGYLLDHPHLVRYVTRSDDSILMDYVDGETLSQFIDHHPDFFEEKKNADRFVLQLLDVIGYLHQHQIIHLDLKPSNILITRIGHDVKLADLGFCYTDTYIDTIGYTQGYAAPELLTGSSLPDARADIYAIGKILQQLPCASRYAKVIRRCTDHDPNKRYSSVEEIAREISPKHRLLWPWLLVLLIVAVSLYAFFFFQQKETKSSPSQPVSIEEAQLETQEEIRDDSTSAPVEERHITEQTKDVVSETAPHVETTPAVVTEKKERHPQKVDLPTLRKDLEDICRPVFNAQLGAYRDSSYESVGPKRRAELTDRFRETVNPLYDQLWERRYKDAGGITLRDFYGECLNTTIHFIDIFNADMERNDQSR
jgi:serine/threonine protein kinase